MNAAAPHLHEDLLTPLFYTTDLAMAAGTDVEGQRSGFEALLNEMEQDDNRSHFVRHASLRLRANLNPEQKQV